MSSDAITIIRACRGKRLAKVIHPAGKIDDYDSAYTYDLIPHPVADLDALWRLLNRLLSRPDCAVVRGAPIDPQRRANVRRLAYPDRDTGDQPTLSPQPHWWLALDMDGIERPAHVQADDLTGCAKEAIARLPAAFRSVRCIVQASASHGIKPGCRLRLWYWMDRLTTDAEATYWLRGVVDPAVFRTVQPIYTAAPVFAEGMQDHLPTRIAAMPGAAAVAVPSPPDLIPPAPKPPPPLPRPTDSGAGRYAFAALANAAARVQRASVGDRHKTLLREAAGLARFIHAGLLSSGDVSGTLHGAGASAGKPEKEIARIVRWAMDHPSTASLPGNVIR